MTERLPDENPMRALIVEDDAGQAELIAELLGAEGFQTTTCATARAALDRAGREAFTIAVVDLNLPDGGGTDFLATLIETDRQMRVVVHTGYSTHEAAVQALNLGAFGYIHKGDDPDLLIRASHQAASAYTSEALRSTEARLQQIADNAPQGIFYLDAERRFRFVNRRFCEWAATEASKVLGRSLEDILLPEVYATVAPVAAETLAGESVQRRRWLTFRDGRLHYAHMNFVPDHDTQGDVQGLFCFVLDETEQHNAERALAQSEATFRAVYESSGMGILLLGENGRITSCNHTLQRMLGLGEQELVGSVLARHVRHEDLAREAPLHDAMVSGQLNHYAVEQRLLRSDGNEVWANVIISAVRDPAGKLLFRIAMVEDISDKKRMSEELSFQARHDALTGLVNRREFEERLRRILGQEMADDTEHALCYLDLDQFKIINDTCGHIAGDELLRQLGGMLPHKVRRRDTLARLGGDEFGVLMEHCPLSRAERVAGEIRDALDEFRFHWEDKTFRVGASIGLVPLAPGVQSVADVLSAADAACYAAKESGRNRVHIYRPDDDELLRRHSEMQWFARIGRALDEDRFELHRQPIAPTIPRAGDTRQHFELLVRMRDEDNRLIPPGAFLPAAERYSLMARIDKWVIEHALRWLGADRENLANVDLCSINLSAQSLSDPSVLGFILEHMARNDVPGERLCLEITETTMIANLPKARVMISKLRREGIRFALDDFGSGFASFAYLKNLQVDFLKIDGVFVKDIAEDPLDRAMVSSINQIGQVMGKTTIAEFVENDAILAHLREIGVDYAQGYGIGRPEPIVWNR